MNKDRINFVKVAEDGMSALLGVEQIIEKSDLDPLLIHLVKLRVSQINRCAFCVGLHIKEALADGEQQQRLDFMIVWRESDLYTPGERAALEWAEALTVPGDGEGLGRLHANLQQYLSPGQIGTLMLVIMMINGWNRLQVASHGDRF